MAYIIIIQSVSRVSRDRPTCKVGRKTKDRPKQKVSPRFSWIISNIRLKVLVKTGKTFTKTKASPDLTATFEKRGDRKERGKEEEKRGQTVVYEWHILL